MQHNVPHSHSTTNDAANLGRKAKIFRILKESQSHCFSEGWHPGASSQGLPLFTRKRLCSYPLKIHQKTSEENRFRHHKSTKKKLEKQGSLSVSLRTTSAFHCHAHFTKHCEGFVVQYTLIWQFVVSGCTCIISFSIKQAKLNPSTEKMRPLQKVGRANQSSNLASPVTCKCINNDLIRVQLQRTNQSTMQSTRMRTKVVVPPSHMANCDLFALPSM